MRRHENQPLLIALLVGFLVPHPVSAQTPAGTVFEETVAARPQLRQGGVPALDAERRRNRPGDRRARAGLERRRPRPGGRSGLAGVRRRSTSSRWSACRFTDKPHDQGFIEDYVNVSQGSGQALLDALTAFATRARHPELATAPFLLWGMSAGGQFNYEFVCWKPERVVAFVVNKGGIYYTALAPRAARQVPGMLFIGGKDLEFRTNTITGLFAVNRRGGALWALAEEPSAAPCRRPLARCRAGPVRGCARASASAPDRR